MSLSNERQKWKPLSIKDEVRALISEEQTGPEWSGNLTVDSDGTPHTTNIDEVLPSKVNALAAKIVNNRVADPIGAIAYGREDGIDYGPERPGENVYNRTLIANMLNAKSYSGYLAVRLFWTFALIGISTAIFYLLVWFGASRGWMGGLMAFSTSTLFVLGWLLYRFVNERMNARHGGFFPQRSSLMPLQALATATSFLEETLQDFVDDIVDFRDDCITRSDQLPDDRGKANSKAAYFRQNADAMAQSMVTWAIARRAAQYLWFQPINVREKYEMNGLTKFRIEFSESVFTGLVVLLLITLVGSAIFIPIIFGGIDANMPAILWAVEEQGRYLYVWPLAQAIFAAGIALWLTESDKQNYRKDRNKLTFALDDFWRRGTVRTADQISSMWQHSSNLNASSISFPNWFNTAGIEMIRNETDSHAKNFAEEADQKYTVWSQGRIWNDKLVATDPTPQLMRRYLKFLDTVGSRSVVHNRGYSSAPSLPAGIEPDARPRTRALATLARREIWHP